ncbi:MAG TPA: nuclear transport factor 2 family protein [Longimicrobium sp.]|nr:nuclear transport factor 2 family protein [Longimicrobium sp.]
MRPLPMLAALLSLAACDVDRTPPQYLNPRDPAVVERRDAEDELGLRVAAFREALARGDRDDAVAALVPAVNAHVIGMDGNDGRARFGAAGIAQALEPLRAGAGAAVARTPDLRVEADARAGNGWFATHLELLPVTAAGGEPRRARVSGVFARQEGEWRLVQLHLSRAEAPPPVSPAAGSPPASRDSAAAPPEGG